MGKQNYNVVAMLRYSPLLVVNMGEYDWLSAIGVAYNDLNERIEEIKEEYAHTIAKCENDIPPEPEYKLSQIDYMEGDENYIISLQVKYKDDWEIDREIMILPVMGICENRYYPDIRKDG